MYKKINILLIFLLLFVGSGAFAQSQTDSLSRQKQPTKQLSRNVDKNAIKLNPLSLLILTGNIAYERVITPKHSIQIGAYFSGFTLDDITYSGFGVMPEFRYYFKNYRNTTPSGVYIAPFLRYQGFSLSTKDDFTQQKEEVMLSMLGGGVVAGYQFNFGGFILDLFAGAGYSPISYVKVKTPNTMEEEFDTNFLENAYRRAGIKIGYAF